MEEIKKQILALINDCSSLSHNVGDKTVAYTLYKVRMVCAANTDFIYFRNLYERIISVENGARGPITEASIKLLANVRDLELSE